MTRVSLRNIRTSNFDSINNIVSALEGPFFLKKIKCKYLFKAKGLYKINNRQKLFPFCVSWFSQLGFSLRGCAPVENFIYCSHSAVIRRQIRFCKKVGNTQWHTHHFYGHICTAQGKVCRYVCRSHYKAVMRE